MNVGYAQSFAQAEGLQANGAYYHVFAHPGEPTIQVYVFGTVPATGIFQVGMETDLAQLLAMAGGLQVDPKSAGQSRTTTIRLLRKVGSQREVLFERPLEELLTKPDTYPSLQEGDVVEVDVSVRTKQSWIEIVRTVASFATFAIAIERIVARTR